MSSYQARKRARQAERQIQRMADQMNDQEIRHRRAMREHYARTADEFQQRHASMQAQLDHLTNLLATVKKLETPIFIVSNPPIVQVHQ